MTSGLRNLDRARRALADRPALGAGTDLHRALDDVRAALAGQLRVVALGGRSCLKSTTLDGLAGRPAGVPRGTGVATELRLVPAHRCADDARSGPEVVILTERAAERRVALAATDAARAELMRRIEEDAAGFGFGSSLPLAAYEARGGSLAADGRGAAVVDRVVCRVPVPVDVWDLSSLAPAELVLVDTPGRRDGRHLEDVVRREQEAAAHVILELVDAGSDQDPPPPPDPRRPRILVLTRVDAVVDPGALAPGLTAGASPARLAVSCPPWGCATEAAWREDHADAEVWHRAEAARCRWDDVPEPLRTAIDGARHDGGTERLRALVIAACAGRQPSLDQAHLDRAVQAARGPATELRAGAPDDARQRRRHDAVARDIEPVGDLLDEARVQAALAVYGDVVWARLRDGDQGALGHLDLRAMAARAVKAFDEETADVLTAWLEDRSGDDTMGGGSIGTSSGVAAVTADAAATPGVGDVADVFDRRGQDLVGHLGAPISFRDLARVRHELAVLLERLLIERAGPALDAARWAALAARGTDARSVIGDGALRALRQLAPPGLPA